MSETETNIPSPSVITPPTVPMSATDASDAYSSSGCAITSSASAEQEPYQVGPDSNNNYLTSAMDDCLADSMLWKNLHQNIIGHIRADKDRWHAIRRDGNRKHYHKRQARRGIVAIKANIEEVA